MDTVKMEEEMMECILIQLPRAGGRHCAKQDKENCGQRSFLLFSPVALQKPSWLRRALHLTLHRRNGILGFTNRFGFPAVTRSFFIVFDARSPRFAEAH